MDLESHCPDSSGMWRKVCSQPEPCLGTHLGTYGHCPRPPQPGTPSHGHNLAGGSLGTGALGLMTLPVMRRPFRLKHPPGLHLGP